MFKDMWKNLSVSMKATVLTIVLEITLSALIAMVPIFPIIGVILIVFTIIGLIWITMYIFMSY